MKYTKALSLTRLAYDLENLLSPSLGAALLLVVSHDTLFVANGVLFLVSGGLIATAPSLQPALQGSSSSPLSRVKRGLWMYLQTPRLRSLVALSLSVSAIGAMVIVNTVSLVRVELGLSESAMALATALFGAGSMASALLLPRLLERYSEAVVMRSGIALAAVALSAFVWIPVRYPELLGAWFVAGAGTSAATTPSGRLLRRSTHAESQTEVFAAHFSLSHLCWLVTYPLAGWLWFTGPRVAFGCLTAIAAGGLAVSILLWRRHDELAIAHTHEECVHSHAHFHDSHHSHAHPALQPSPPEKERPHQHEHRHERIRHAHPIVVDDHHPVWPRG